MPTYTFTNAEANEVYSALLDRQFETLRYLSSYRDDEAADPECCDRCRSEFVRQEDRKLQEKLLRQRLDAVVSATNTIRPPADVQPSV